MAMSGAIGEASSAFLARRWSLRSHWPAAESNLTGLPAFALKLTNAVHAGRLFGWLYRYRVGGHSTAGAGERYEAGLRASNVRPVRSIDRHGAPVSMNVSHPATCVAVLFRSIHPAFLDNCCTCLQCVDSLGRSLSRSFSRAIAINR
jgi:hypothetical protein